MGLFVVNIWQREHRKYGGLHPRNSLDVIHCMLNRGIWCMWGKYILNGLMQCRIGTRWVEVAIGRECIEGHRKYGGICIVGTALDVY